MEEPTQSQGCNLPNSPLTGFKEIVFYERERCQRHNHYFAILGVHFWSSPRIALMEKLERLLRTSDLLCRINDEKWAGENSDLLIGILLPETDRKGAEAVLNRLRKAMVGNEFDLGLAVYPDDETDSMRLMESVFAI